MECSDTGECINITSLSDYGPYPDFTQIPAVCGAFVALYGCVMVLSLAGNAMVCCTVFRNRKMHTVVNYYIVNLAVCDFAVGGFVLPVKLMELAGPAQWSFMTNALCTAMLYLQTIVVFASVLTLVATCLERYFAIVHPLVSRMQQSKARAKRILLAVWATPCLVALPFLYPARAESDTLTSQYGSISRRSCLITLEERFRRGYYAFLFLFMYLLPLIFIGWTCFRIARCLLRGISLTRQGSLRRQEANRRKVAKMVMVVVVAFAVAWTPYFLVSIFTQFGINYLENQNYFFTMLCINLFAFLNSCVNPFIYAAMSTRFRNGFRRILRSALCCCCVAPAPGTAFQRAPVKKLRNRTPLLFLCNDTSVLSSDSGSQSDSIQHTAVQLQHQIFSKRPRAGPALSAPLQNGLAPRGSSRRGKSSHLNASPKALRMPRALSDTALSKGKVEEHPETPKRRTSSGTVKVTAPRVGGDLSNNNTQKESDELSRKSRSQLDNASWNGENNTVEMF
ncbi:QRFP-like peptide receptor [Ornithodoros turicata]|uniref:QRFP-like peptide receptor n=1 Tax=Ornithodoros turicata TaxID=34597 RepID=UPI003139B0D6